MTDFEKRFRLGVNYWPRHHGVRMWKEWKPEEIDTEFAEMRSVGLDLARVFITWDDFQPIKEYLGGARSKHFIGFQDDEAITPHNNPCMINPSMIKRFDTLIKIATKNKIYLEPALITGFMSGALLEPTYRRDRNIYTDPFMLKWQNKLVQFFAQRYRNEKMIIAWALGNECDCMDICPSEEAAWLWTANLTQTLRLFDPQHPVISSMHGLKPIRESNWTINDQGELCDILTTHPYPQFTPGCNLDGPTDMRTILHAAAESEMCSGLGKKPVLCEETGTLGNSRFSEEESAKFLRLRLYSLLNQRNLGCLWWCHTDFTCDNIVPYNYEMMENDGLGIFDREGRPKPLAKEFKKFRPVLDSVGGNLPVLKKKAVIIVPRNANNWLPYFNAYILSKQAGIEPTFAWEYDDISTYQLAICPSVAGAAPYWSESWENLISFVQNGGVLYLSYDGCSLRKMAEVFGIKIDFRQRELNQKQILGFNKSPWYKGESDWELIFHPTAGKTILQYENKRPALIENKIGKGKTLFFTEPVETVLAKTLQAYKNSQVYLLYDYLREVSKIEKEVEINDPQVERTWHPINENSAFLVLINYHRQTINLNIRLKRKIKKIEPLVESSIIKNKINKNFQVAISGSQGTILEIKF